MADSPPQPVLPPLTDVSGKTYRLVASQFPPIALFEHLLDPEELELAYALEAMTNDRIRDEVGDIALVARQDRMVGAGTSAIMAAFTHIGRANRFNDASFGAYYAACELHTAISETVYHRERFLSATAEPATQITLRCYIASVREPLHDIRSPDYRDLHHPEDYGAAQRFARELRAADSWGLYYHSVRRRGGECVAVFRPPALTPAVQGKHYAYYWDGERIAHVAEMRQLPL